MYSDNSYSSRNSSVTSSILSKTSSTTYRRKARPNVGDTVRITSSSNLYVNHSNDIVNNATLVGSDKPIRCDKVNIDMLSENIRSSKDVPKFRNKIFEDSLESQEVSFYVDDDSEAYYENLDTQSMCDQYDSFEEESDSENYENFVVFRRNIDDVPLPEPPTNETYGIGKFAKNIRRIKRNISKDIGRSLRRLSQKMSVVNEADIKVSEQSREEQPAAITHIKEDDLKAMQDTRSMSNSFLSRVRRSISLSSESALNVTTKIDNQRRSTFYLTEPFDADDDIKSVDSKADTASLSSVPGSKSKVIRPKCPPPPIPAESNGKGTKCNEMLKTTTPTTDNTTSLYSDAGLFKNNNNTHNRSSNTAWYAEIGLYPKTTANSTTSSSTDSSKSSYSNPSGNRKNYASVITELNFKLSESGVKNADNTKSEINKSDSALNNQSVVDYNNTSSAGSDSGKENESVYYNQNDENNYYNNQSVCSFNSSDSKKDDSSITYSKSDIQFLEDEPLYQFYDAAVLENLYLDDISDFDSDVYEDMNVEVTNEEYSTLTPSPPPPPSVSPIESTDHHTAIQFTRSLWCEVPEVLKSSVLSQLSSHQKKLQEAKFEIITSEASYLNSLNVLHDHFISKFRKSNIVNEKEMEILFGKFKQVRSCSKKILYDLDKCWKKNILLDGICDIIQKHAEEDFDVYIPYCENQVLLGETMNEMRGRPEFLHLLSELESSISCQFLTLYSFLMLPMQRITRWPLLIDAILKRLSENDPEYLTCQYALACLNKIVHQCNEAARKKEREIELEKISKTLEFPRTVPHIDVIHSNRWLIRSGFMTSFQPRSEDTKMTFGKRFSKVSLHLFMFNDLLLVTKKKKENIFTVLHYSPRNLIELRSVDLFPNILRKEAQDKNVLYLSILENQEGKIVELLLSSPTETEKERWIEAFSTPKSENPDETVYECWDCPQVMVLHNYSACQPDELSLCPGDVINVLRKMSDGWYNGERLRDGQTGWFPSNYTNEIINPHVRARNIKQRYRLLTFSEHYLKT